MCYASHVMTMNSPNAAADYCKHDDVPFQRFILLSLLFSRSTFLFYLSSICHTYFKNYVLQNFQNKNDEISQNISIDFS